MRNLWGKIAISTGSAVLAGCLLVVAYLSGGAFILSGLLAAVFLIGERTDVAQYVFGPIALAAALIFGASSWGLAMIGAGAWWLWRKPSGQGRDERS
jgi:hypothetical protein